MLIKVKRELSETEALGQQNRGIVNPALTEDQKALLYEYRMDAKLDPCVGLQFTPESDLPWLRPDTVKLNLGVYRQFTTPGWFNIGDVDQEKRDFNVPLGELNLTAESVDFIFAAFCLETLLYPLRALRMWRDILKPKGILAVSIHDRDELIRTGRRFECARFNDAELARLLREAGFEKLVPIDFRTFDLAGADPAYKGYFAER